MRLSHVLLAGLLLAAPALAGDDPPYPKGDSNQVFGKNPFDLRIPKDFDKGKKYGLVLVLPGGLGDLEGFKDEPYVVCRPHPGVDPAGNMWSGGEVKVILNLIAHLRKVLPIDPERIHAVSVGGRTHSIFEMVVFNKKTPFVSATYLRSGHKRGKVPAVAKKKIGVLAFKFKPERTAPGVDQIVELLTGRVRSVELREEGDGLGSAYYRYWLGVMEGRFEPGHDLSLAWREDAERVEDLSAAMRRNKSGGMVYFWSKKDRSSPEAKALQNTVFFDPVIRARAENLVAFKLEREKHKDLFAHFGLKTTPAIVVLDTDGTVIKAMQGPIKAKALARLLKKPSGAK